MMKQFFISIMVTCVFCLATMPVQADNTHGTFILKDSTKYDKQQVVEATKSQVMLQNPIEKKLKAYPNPVDRGSLLTIEMPDGKDELTIFLYNTVGKVIQTFKTSDKKVEFNAPDVSGIYLLRFVEKQKVIAVEKIVVKG